MDVIPLNGTLKTQVSRCAYSTTFFFFFKSLEEKVLWSYVFSQSGTGSLKGHHLGDITCQHISKTLKM